MEFWQEDTFDPETIDRELRWSADLGFNLHRVFLHNLLWDQDSAGFLNRLDTYLTLSEKYGIKTMLVLLDDVWNPVMHLGKQPEPIPHVHNSQWVQAPGAEILGDSSRHDELRGYIKGVIARFAHDPRVLVWDLYNEPDNVNGDPERGKMEVKNKAIFSLALLRKVVRWAREVDPDQPLTSGLWRGKIENWGNPDSLPAIDRFMVENSDIITFHAYDSFQYVQGKIAQLKKYNRPMICTEYLVREYGNRFDNIMPLFKSENIGAINWGFVAGKTQTNYPWRSWREKFTTEPKVWHHDILRKDGMPFSEEEVRLIKRLMGKK